MDTHENETRAVLLEDILMNNDPGHQWHVRWEHELPSTMDRVREMLGLVATDSSALCIADVQTAGRGTRGRSWISPSGGLYSTTAVTVARGGRALDDLPALSLVVGRVVAETLQELGADVGVKWPNDVLSRDGKKISGNLLELVREGSSEYLLIGVGINIEHVSLDISAEATSLSALRGAPMDRGQLAALLMPRIRRAAKRCMEQGFKEEAARWSSRALWRGESVIVESDGEEMKGVFEGVDSEGRLMLRCSDGTRTLRSGRMRKEGR